MMLKGLAIIAVLLVVMQLPVSAFAQTTNRPASSQPAYSASTRAAQPPATPDCNGVPCEEQQPHVIVTLPAPAPTVWSAHDRILWAAYLVLAILGYVGVMLAVSTLKKIERHTIAAETAAKAVAEIAQASLLHAQSILNAERPWLLISVEPSLGVENSFSVTATNRGRSPAIIISALDQVLLAVDEAHLPASPPLKETEQGAPVVPIILLPGEYAAIKTITREDAKALCGSDEKFKSIEAWEERIFLCGRVMYNDLIAPAGKETHLTGWCCWYIHGRQKSGLVIAGPPEYHSHT